MSLQRNIIAASKELIRLCNTSQRGRKMFNIEKWQLLFPLIYLLTAAFIAIVCHVLKVPDGISGLLVGAALTRVKMPTKMP